MIGLVLFLACSGEDLPPPPGGPEPSDSGVSEACDDVPHVTWEDWGWGFMMTYCQGCHASTAPYRYGAPTGVAFDTEADAQTWSERIRVRTLEQQDMPPAGGIPSEELAVLTWWLDCGL